MYSMSTHVASFLTPAPLPSMRTDILYGDSLSSFCSALESHCIGVSNKSLGQTADWSRRKHLSPLVGREAVAVWVSMKVEIWSQSTTDTGSVCGILNRKWRETKEMGFDMWNGHPNYESLPLPGTGKREGREYTKPFQQLSSRPFTVIVTSIRVTIRLE